MAGHGSWKGIPREKIPWYPAVDTQKCVGCKACFNFCGHGVYDWDEKHNVSKVARPFACVVGCSNCAGKCPVEAIGFPPLTVLKNLQP